MTLTTTKPMRSCGRPFSSEKEALNSKRGQSGNYFAARCRQGCPDGTWHLRRKLVSAGVTRKPPPADTGPDRKTRTLVLSRDKFACVCHGIPVLGRPYELQHRVSRGMGGSSDPAINSPANLLTMLRECHQRVEKRGAHDHEKGYWLRMGESPLLVPVMYFSPDGSGVLMYLDDDGGIGPDAPMRGVP